MAVKASTHFKQVNRRILGVRFLLKKSRESDACLTPIEQQALKESAQLQFYFALVSYLHELSSYYHRVIPEQNATDLAYLFFAQQSPLLTVPEFAMLREWNIARGDIIRKLSTLADNLIFPEEDSSVELSSGSVNVKVGLNVIASDTPLSIDVNSTSDLLILLGDFQSLIEKQRENQAEY